MFEKIGKKLVQGAKAEIQEKPVSILDTDKFLEWAEVAIGIGLLAIGFLKFLKKPETPAQPTTIVINNYISKD